MLTKTANLENAFLGKLTNNNELSNKSLQFINLQNTNRLNQFVVNLSKQNNLSYNENIRVINNSIDADISNKVIELFNVLLDNNYDLEQSFELIKKLVNDCYNELKQSNE
jgi:hypothetical protein